MLTKPTIALLLLLLAPLVASAQVYLSVPEIPSIPRCSLDTPSACTASELAEKKDQRDKELREYAAKAALDNAKREADQRAAEFARQKRLDEIAKLTEESNARARALYGAKDQAKADYERELAQTQRDRAQRKCRFCSLPAKASSQ